MMTINQSLQRLIQGSAIASFLFIPCNPILAQITPDSTLGAEGSSILPNGVVIDGVTADLIQDGASRGSALFHSFLEFNINEGQRVYFANPDGIEAIFSRVTGTDPSDILGTLGVNGAADLIFINPNGILFGENAQLDIRGSFIGSTANGVVFENGTTFSATNPEAPPLLTINLTPGLQYGSNHPGRTITNSGNLAVGQDLTLASAGNLDLQGQLQAGGNLTLFATDTVKMRDSVANPFIAAAMGQLLVQGNQSVDIFALNHPDSGLFSGGDMTLRSANTVAGDAHYWSGGNFQIEQLDGSLGNLLSPDDPIIRSRGDVRFNGYQGASLHILAGGQVRIGQVTITRREFGRAGNDYIDEDVTLSDGQVVHINGRERPTFDVRAGVDPNVIGKKGVTGLIPVIDTFFNLVPFAYPDIKDTVTNADIRIRSISIEQPNGQVLLTNQYEPNTEISGNIQVNEIRVDDNNGAFPSFKGDGGDVFFDSRGDITISNAGEIGTNSATGDAGDITMLAQNSISLSDEANIQSVTNGSGKGGDITIQAWSLSMMNNVQLATATFGTGDAGNVNINVTNTFSIRDSAILSTVGSGAVANAGDIEIEAGSVQLKNRAFLWTSSWGEGNAGNVSVEADDSVEIVDNSVILTGVYPEGMGNAGDVDIKSRTLSLTSGSGIFTNSNSDNSSAGTAGSIQINAEESVTLSGVSSVYGYSSGLYAGNADNFDAPVGEIEVTTGTFRITDGAVIDNSTYNSSDGATVTINSDTLELTGGGQVLAVTRGSGKAGTIDLNVTDNVTISGNDSTYFNRLLQFGPDVVTNEPSARDLTDTTIVAPSGLFAGSSVLGVGLTGNGGTISINDTKKLTVSNDGQISTAAFGTADAGNIFISNTGSINVSDGGRILTAGFGTGNIETSSDGGAGGELFIDTESLSIRDQSQVFSGTGGAGTGGNITVKAANSVEVINDSLLSTDTVSSGNAGNLTIETRNLTVGDRAGISSSTQGAGQGGILSVDATDSVTLDNQGAITTYSNGTGDAGHLEINTDKLEIQNESVISSSTFSSGTAGNLTITADNSINLNNQSRLEANTFGSGNGGNLRVDTGNLNVENQSKVSSSTLGSGRGGNLSIDAVDAVNIDSESTIATFSTDINTGAAGNLSVETGQLSIQNESAILTSTLSANDAGDLTIKATDSIELANRSFVSSGTVASGNAGDLTIETKDLNLRDTAIVSSSTTGSGEGGNLRVQASDSVNLTNFSAIITASGFMDVNNPDQVMASAGDTGKAGDLSIETQTLSIRDRSLVSTTTISTNEAGDAGDLTVQATDSVEVINGSRLLADTLEHSRGDGGNLTVKTGTFSIRDNSEVRASTALFSRGQAGTINVDAADSVEISGSSALFTLTGGSGRAGDMIVNTGKVVATDGGRIEAGTFGIAPGGNLTVNASESIALRGSSLNGFRSGLSAFSLTLGNARSGNLTVNTGDFTINDGAEVTVTSLKGQAGNVDITANSLWLNQGYVTAETRLGEGEGGANIFLQLDEDLILRNESLISATAFEEANGGNITLNTRFVIGLPPEGPEGSDIIANAFFGDGGRVNVTAQYLFDIDFRDRRTPLNDITASSEFGEQGVVTIETPGIDPNAGLVQLPPPASPPEFVNFCQGRSDQTPSHFIISGRGGVPPTISQVTGTYNVWEDLRPLTPSSDNSPAKIEPVSQRSSRTIIEAQGWIKLPDGTIVLTAQAPNVTPNTGWQNPLHCQSAVE
ncbi:MAG: filamentous hemagglutinin N-terminal domain-containing protein [Coleofasciculus sp. C1-SOL-03]|uniref:two-partner secretion domain-containing protein n=1 Tax=Coleofasciculus sp. C1-SOL-03 TaxID=3069522 RepID=UPI00330429E5